MWWEFSELLEVMSFLISVSSSSLACDLVLKLLKMAKGIRALLDTVIQALPQVGNLVRES